MIPPCTPEWSTKEAMVKRTRALKTVSGRSEVARSLASRGRLAIITSPCTRANPKRTRKLQQKRSGFNGTLRCRQFTGTIILQPFYSTLEQRPTVSLNSVTQKPQVSQSCALKVQNMPKGGKGGSKLRLPDQTGAGWPALQGP